MKCKCLEKLEKENGVTITVFVTVRTKDGFTKRIPVNSGICPLCGRRLADKPKKNAKNGV